MWPWNRPPREPIGEPPPELEVFPAEVLPGHEVTIGIQAPPYGVMEVEFELEAPPVEAPVAIALEPAPPPAAPPARPPVFPLPGSIPAPVQTPLIRAPSVSTATASTSQLPGLADQIANVIAYAIVFYGMVAAAMAANFKFGFLVTFAMMAIVWYLRDVIVTPLQGLVRSIVIVIFHVLIEVVDFVWEWLRGVTQLFGGDLVRAILQVLMVAAFLWVWEQATQIPVIGQLFTWIQNTAQDVLTWVQTQIQVVTKFFDDARVELEAKIVGLTKDLGNVGDELRSLLDQQVQTLFSRIQFTVTGLRTEVLGRLDFVRLAVNLQTGIFAAALHISPETARRYLAAYARHNPHEAVAHGASVWASTARGQMSSVDFTRTPWDAVDELRADFAGVRRGVTHDGHTWAQELIADLKILHAGNVPDVPPFAPDLVDQLLNTGDPGPGPELPAVPAEDIPPVEAVG